MSDDPVNHPRHYQHASGVECIVVAEHMNFCRGNALKYLWRAGEKSGAANEIEDLRKARWYLDREIARLEKTAGTPKSETATRQRLDDVLDKAIEEFGADRVHFWLEGLVVEVAKIADDERAKKRMYAADGLTRVD